MKNLDTSQFSYRIEWDENFKGKIIVMSNNVGKNIYSDKNNDEEA